MTDSILIIGGGIAGLHAAMECANAGARAVVVEREPIIGGRLAAALTAATAMGDRAEGVPVPLLTNVTENENIEIITLGELEKIEGRPGYFTVSIRERARYVTDACTRCKLCHTACPVVLPNEFDAGLTFRKAIYTPMADTVPEPYVIDIENCLNTPPNYQPCQRCVEVCDDNAIFFNLVDTLHERQVGAIILATGFRIEDSASYAEFGYGTHPDIVTSAELQRLMESPGPTGGFATKPSNEEYPNSVLLVLDNLSPFALYIVASQVHQLVEQDVETVAVLVLSQLNQETDRANVLELGEKTGVKFSWGATIKVATNTENGLDVSYEDFSENRFVRETYDMVVLCSDVEPADNLALLAGAVGIQLDDNGYVAVDPADEAMIATSRPGIFVAGCASGPANIKQSIASARAAATAAISLLDQRLLQPDEPQVPAASTTGPAAAAIPLPPDLSENEQRARIEQMLYALLDR
jgi:heterodisulfide reductase subunit A